MSEIRVDTISEKTSANGVSIDGVTIKDGGIAATDGSTITTADNTDTLTLISTDADATQGPVLNLYRNSSAVEDDNDIARINFTGNDSGGNATTYASTRVIINDVTDGTEDTQIIHSQMIGGAFVSTLRCKPDEIVINDSSIDLDFRVESNNNEHMFFVNGGDDRVGFKTAPDLGHVHIRIGDSGGSVNSAADCLVIEESGNAGMTILTGNTTSGSIHFGDNGDNDKGFISYSHNTDDMFFSVNGNGSAYSLVLHDGGQVSTGGETNPDGGDGALCLDQNANDGNILTFKSSDVAHGITGSNETDTYLTMGKASATQGGLVLKSYAEGDDGFLAESFCGTINTTKGTGGNACFMFKGRAADNGSGFQNPTSTAANANLFAIANGNLRVFIFDGEGDLHADGALNATAYDTYEDAHLVRAMDLSHGQNLKGLVNSKFDEYINYNHETLAEAGLVGREEDGTPNHFINVTGMQRLHNGAIWQQYEKTQRLTNAFYKLATKTIGKAEADKLLTEEEIQLLN